MGLRIHERRAALSPWNYGGACVFVLGLLTLMAQAQAQQASSPGFDVRQTERRFEDLETEQGPGGRRGVAVPRVSRSETSADPTPLFVLRNVSLTGAHAIAPEHLAEAWRPFVGKKVSQADLVTIATGIGDAYRAAGFHLSRAIVPPQDIQRRGPHRGRRRRHHRGRAERRGRRAVRHPRTARTSHRRAPLAAGDAGAPV